MTFHEEFLALLKKHLHELQENAIVKCTITQIAPQVLQPQILTISTSGTHRGPSRLPPGQHHLQKPFAGHFEALRRLCVPEVVGTEAESL